MNKLIDVEKALTEDDLKLFEKNFDVIIPQSIKNHYLKYNGGYPENTVFYSADDDREYVINYFFSIGGYGGKKIEKTLTLLRDENVFPNWLIPFADDIGGDIFAYSLRNGEEGSIYYYSHEFDYGENPEEHVTKLADNIEAFLEVLLSEEE